MPAYNFTSTNTNSTTGVLDVLNAARQKCINSSMHRSNIISVILNESSNHSHVCNCSLNMKEVGNMLKIDATCQKTYANWKYQIALPANNWTTSSANWVVA